MARDLKKDFQEPLEKFLFALEEDFAKKANDEMVRLLIGLGLEHGTALDGAIPALCCTRCGTKWPAFSLATEDGHAIARHWVDGEDCKSKEEQNGKST